MKYYIITIGCQMNKSDSERVASYLEQNNYTEASQAREADIVVLNTCGVRQSAEDRIYGLIPRIKKENPGCRLILTGCLNYRNDVRQRVNEQVDLFLFITDLPFLFQKLGMATNEKESETGRNEYLRISPKWFSEFRAYIPLGNGCNNFCSYCVVPYARGREVYRPAEEVVKEVEEVVSKGYTDIVLIAQNVNSYISEVGGGDRIKEYIGPSCAKVDFADLLRVVDNIAGNFWINFATSHPKDISDKLIQVIAESSKVCRHIHLPAQSGDDEILRKMNRKYSQEHYLELIKKIRQNIPFVSITTDIIVGFPGETEEQFNNTVQLFERAKFDMAYIAQYSPRPGTAAAKIGDDIPSSEKKKREEELMKILRKTAYENNKGYLGKEVEVMIENKNKKGEWMSRTFTNKSVKIIKDSIDLIPGQFQQAEIVDIQDFGLSAQLKIP